jgi:hypothetical protein
MKRIVKCWSGSERAAVFVFLCVFEGAENGEFDDQLCARSTCTKGMSE